MKESISLFSAALLFLAAALPQPLAAADAQSKVLDDIQRFATPSRWIYNDLPRGLAEAQRLNKPILLIFRCVPCVACSQFDQRVLEKGNEIEDLLDLFVCVRIIHGNGMDLSLFQFDYDQSFHVFFLNADQTIYGRFGTRSSRPEVQDMTIEGMRKAMVAALDLHARFPEVKESLAGKRGLAPTVTRPENFPNLQGKFEPTLARDGNIAKSCIHCHQIRESERLTYRNAGKSLPPAVLFPYPLPDVLGLRFNPDQKATVAGVTEGSIAARAGLRARDKLLTLEGQPLLSIADVQWVLHRMPETGPLRVEFERNGKKQMKRINLPPGWRTGDISWRTTTWDLRRMATGGMVLESMPADDLKKLGLGPESLALRVKSLGQYGEHAAGKQAGFQKGDVIVGVDGQHGAMTESQFLALALKRPRSVTLPLQVRRGNDRIELTLPMQ